MNTINRSIITIIIGYLITAVAIIAIPIILISATKRSELFWLRIAWTEFLALLGWGIFGIFAIDAAGSYKQGKGFGGILPVIGFIVIGYILISFILMMMNAFGNEDDTSNRVYSVLQIIIAVIAAVIIVLMYFVRLGTMAGNEPIPSDIMAPSQLNATIMYHETQFRSLQNTGEQGERLKKALESLREKIKYSIPETGPVGRLDIYKKLCMEVSILCNNLSEIAKNTPSQDEIIAEVIHAEDLLNRTEIVIHALKR